MNSKHRAFFRRAARLWAATLVGTSLLGCEVTSEKIQQWKLTEKGPAKLRYAVRDGRQKLTIRAEAAEALGEIGLFAPLAEDLRSISAGDRKLILDQLTRRLLERMKGSNPRATTRVQLQAKDTLFTIRDLLEEPLRRTVDEEVVRWLLGDWANRTEGEHAAEKIVRNIGARAGPLLAEQLTADPAHLASLATLLREVGDPAARDVGAAKLIALAGQQKPIAETTLAALGKLGSLKAIGFLEEQVRRGPAEGRVPAIQALLSFPHKSLLPLARSLAADNKAAPELRDEAFTLLERIKEPGSLEAMLGFLADKEEKIRYRAVEGILEGFGAEGLAKLLEALPPGYTYKKQDLKDLVEDFIAKLGPKALPALRKALSSKSWIARLVAARVLGRLGTAEDVPALEKLAGDGTRVRGWEAGATIGTEARAAVDTIRSRK